MKKKYTGYLFVLPHFLGVCLFLLLPFLDVVRRAFLRTAGGFCGLENFKTVVFNEAFRLAAGNTVKFTLVCLPLLLFLSLLLAVLVYSMGKAAGVLKNCYLVPMAIPAACVALLWKLLFDSHGLVNGVVTSLGGRAVDWMNTGSAFWVLVGSYLWKNTGYVMVLWIAALDGIPKTVYEAAEIDGAGRAAAFFYITLPCIRPAAFTIAVFSFLNSFKVFRETYLVAGNYPHESIYLLQHVFNNWFLSLSVDKMAAGAVLLGLVAGAAVWALQRAWERQ